LFNLADQAYISSKLPDNPDRESVEAWLVGALKKYFKDKGELDAI